MLAVPSDISTFLHLSTAPPLPPLLLVFAQWSPSWWGLSPTDQTLRPIRRSPSPSPDVFLSTHMHLQQTLSLPSILVYVCPSLDCQAPEGQAFFLSFLFSVESLVPRNAPGM